MEEETFEPFGADALTVNGYLGTDGIQPLVDVCQKSDKGIFVLVKTSNPSSGELQDKPLADGNTVYRAMGAMCEGWGEKLPGQYGYSGVGAVVGATYPAQLEELRAAHAPHLLPGARLRAQGGAADDVAPALTRTAWRHRQLLPGHHVRLAEGGRGRPGVRRCRPPGSSPHAG